MQVAMLPSNDRHIMMLQTAIQSKVNAVMRRRNEGDQRSLLAALNYYVIEMNSGNLDTSFFDLRDEIRRNGVPDYLINSVIDSIQRRDNSGLGTNPNNPVRQMRREELRDSVVKLLFCCRNYRQLFGNLLRFGPSQNRFYFKVRSRPSQSIGFNTKQELIHDSQAMPEEEKQAIKAIYSRFDDLDLFSSTIFQEYQKISSVLVYKTTEFVHVILYAFVITSRSNSNNNRKHYVYYEFDVASQPEEVNIDPMTTEFLENPSPVAQFESMNGFDESYQDLLQNPDLSIEDQNEEANLIPEIQLQPEPEFEYQFDNYYNDIFFE